MAHKDDKKKDKKEHKKDSDIEFKTTNLSISTCTVITNLNAKVNLGYLTRYINIYEQMSPELDMKSGGVYNLEFYGNCARGETLVDKIKDEFNNQATIKFKYWGFRMVNVKIFANGRLQMTGLKYEDEAKEVGQLLINILNTTKINVLQDIKELSSVKKTFDYQVVYDSISKKVFYYRKYYDRFLKNYNFDIDQIYLDYQEKKTQSATQSANHLSKYSFDIKRKNFRKGINDVYLDTMEQNHKEFLKANEWYGDNEIMQMIDKIEISKTLFTNDMEQALSSSITLYDLRDNIDNLFDKYQDFRFNELENILMNINRNIYSMDENTLVDIKNEVFQFAKLYRNLLEKKINRLVTIRNVDTLICYNLEKYLSQTADQPTLNNISMEQLDLITGDISEPYNYRVSNTETVLINSDLTVNFNINLRKLSKLLIKRGLFNTYEPDEHSGINLKYYYNNSNVNQGFCNCNPHCSTKEKHPICTKITILIFRPGSIIITGSRNLEQLKSAHQLIIKLMDEHMKAVMVDDTNDDNKHIALMNNEFRKISRKPRLFYIKKANITMA